MQNKSNLVLQQKHKSYGRRCFELKAGRELHIVHTENNKQHKYAFSVLAMCDQGKRIYQFKKRWLILVLGTISTMLLFPRVQYTLPFNIEHFVLYILSGLFFAALLFFMLLVHTFRRRYVFCSIHTRLPLVEFWINNPSRKEYQDFISALEDNIKRYKEEMHIAYDKQLAGELRTLRRVTEVGMLSESVYLAAKAKLLLMSDVNLQAPTDRE